MESVGVNPRRRRNTRRRPLTKWPLNQTQVHVQTVLNVDCSTVIKLNRHVATITARLNQRLTGLYPQDIKAGRGEADEHKA